MTTEIFNYYINTNNKDKGDTNYNYNYRLGNNIHLNENEELYFKLINFSMMNSMLNISSYHGNNQFKVSYGGTIDIITIPDGNYNTTSLRDKINDILGKEPYVLPLALNYESSINKYYWIMSDSCVFYPLNMKTILGFNKDDYNLTIANNTYGESFVNLLSYTKIILTTNNLAFEPTTDNNLIKDYNANEGINEIICWIDKDIPTFATINYENIINNEIKISNKNLTYINFGIMNEYKEHIKDCPNSFIHFQLIKKSY